jgi:lipoic acid synthetase
LREAARHARHALADRPSWLVKRLPVDASSPVPGLLADLKLNTVCRSAKCPNLSECWAGRTATFMVMGDRCTRDCRFCAVAHGLLGPPDPDEPARVAEAARRLELGFVVVTSVTRDDLEDGGAAHFAATVRAVHDIGAGAEVLVPDFGPDDGTRAAAVRTVMEAGPEVFGHNVETVPRLYRDVRPGADYARSLSVLEEAARFGESMPRGKHAAVKSGMMLGLGERADEVERVLRDLRSAGAEIVTMGQYLRPGATRLPVAEWVEPARFEEYASLAREVGFAGVAAGPFVRSSYKAADLWETVRSAQ